MPRASRPSVRSRSRNTTLVLVVTDGRLDKLACHLLAQSAHDGVAHALHPAHTRFDGDVSVAVATGTVDAHLDRLRASTIDVAASAIRNAAVPQPGIRG